MKKNVKIGDCYLVRHEMSRCATHCVLVLNYRFNEFGIVHYQKLTLSWISNKLYVTYSTGEKIEYDRYLASPQYEFL